MPTTTTSMPTMLVVLMTLLSPAALVLASDSLSVGRGFTAQNSLSLPRDSSGRPDYCVITKAHTACNLKKGFGAQCGGTVLSSGVNTAEKAEIVRVHNELRARLANGLERRGRPGPQPPAADMEQMS